MSENVVRSANSAELLTQIQAVIGPALRETEQVFAAELATRHPFVREVLDHLLHYRGKRMRLMPLLLTAQALGPVEHAHAVLAAVVEMIHTATLVHDDVLDEAATCRHVATVNSRWSNETSVLLGDYLFTHAFHLTSSLGSAQACQLIGHATNVVCEGEMWQISERGNLDLSEETYIEIIEAKTGRLCAVSCYLGALQSGASKQVADALDHFGRSLGIAFQIADDLLDVLGTEAATGKSLGSDIKKQKLTLPIIHALATLPEAAANTLRNWLAQPDDQTRQRIQPFLDQTQAIEYAQARANAYAVAARQSLVVLPDSKARQLLEELTEFATLRSS